ncbi:MAG: cell division protein ZapA [Hyphomicrobiales bacterium]
MAQVVVTVNGRAYTMQCNDGEEQHLAELGELLDSEIERIKDAVGQVGDVRLLLMGGLVVADKLADALKRIEDLEAQIRTVQASRNGAVRQGQELEETVVARLDAAARRLEAMAQEAAQPEVQKENTA